MCLDETNLAPVEQYFAEFLSASEDVKKADDGKTLVSAALIKPSDFGGDVLNLEPEYELAADRKTLIEKIGLFILHNLMKLDDVFRGKLETLRGDLEISPFAIAYRFAREAVMYREAIAKIGNDTAKAAKDEIALDHMSLMKILPRITGTTTERKGVTDKLSAFFSGLGRSLSLKKLNEMKVAASGNGEYLSFWP